MKPTTSFTLSQFNSWASQWTAKSLSAENRRPKAIVSLDKNGTRLTFSMTDKVYHALGRSSAERASNDMLRELFKNAIRDAFGGKDIPPSVMKVYRKSFFISEAGCPLTARRIAAVIEAVRKAGGKVDETAAPEPPKTEQPKTEPPKTEPPKTEPTNPEPPKTEPTTTEIKPEPEIKDDLLGGERPTNGTADVFTNLDPAIGGRNDGNPPFLLKAKGGGPTLINLSAFLNPKSLSGQPTNVQQQAAATFKNEVRQFLECLRIPLGQHLNGLRDRACDLLGLATDAQKSWFDTLYGCYNLDDNNLIVNAGEILKTAMNRKTPLSLKDFVSKLTGNGLVNTTYRNKETGQSIIVNLKDYNTLEEWSAATGLYKGEPWEITSDSVEGILAQKENVEPANDAFLAFKRDNPDLGLFRDTYLTGRHAELLSRLSAEEILQLKADIDVNILDTIKTSRSLTETGRAVFDSPISTGCKSGPDFAEFVKSRIDRIVSDAYTFTEGNGRLIGNNQFLHPRQQLSVPLTRDGVRIATRDLAPWEIVGYAINKNFALKQCGGNNCFMVSVVNGLLNTAKGREVLRRTFSGDGCVFRYPSLAGKGKFTVSPAEIAQLKKIFGKATGMSELEIAIWAGLCKRKMLIENVTGRQPQWDIASPDHLSQTAVSWYNEAKLSVTNDGPGNQGVAEDVASLFGYTKPAMNGGHADNTAPTASKRWVTCKNVSDDGGIVIHHTGGRTGGHYRAVIGFANDSARNRQYQLAESMFPNNNDTPVAAATSINLKKSTLDDFGDSVEYFTYVEED